MRFDIRNAALACFIFLVVSCLGCGASADVAKTAPDPTPMRSIPTPPPLDSRPKLVAFGDSFTAGLGIEDWRHNYPSLLQQDLDKAGLNIQVVNRGRPGDTSTQGLARIDEALGTGEVRIFILALGGNDVFKKVPIAETRISLTRIITAATDKGAKVLLCGYKPVDDTSKKAMDAMYADLAAEYQVALMPSLLEGVQDNPDLLLPDGVHPNEAGARVIEQNVWKALQPLLVNEQKTKKKAE
jgi:acyl-CoA thioesterase-1